MCLSQKTRCIRPKRPPSFKDKYGIQDEDVCYLDETGFQMGVNSSHSASQPASQAILSELPLSMELMWQDGEKSSFVILPGEVLNSSCYDDKSSYDWIIEASSQRLDVK